MKKEASVTTNESDIKIEIEKYFMEKNRIGKVVKCIEKIQGGKVSKILDSVFILSIISLFVLRFIFNVIDNILSLELGLLLISIKIIWLIKIQNKYNHFIFMIMYTIEQHQILLSEKIDQLAKKEE